MDDLLLKYNEYMRLDGFRLEYEMYNGIRIEVTYKEENFAHLLGLHQFTTFYKNKNTNPSFYCII